MSDSIRAFVALKLPESIISSIKKIQEDMKLCRFPVRWVRPEKIHLTIKFFGEITESDIKNIEAWGRMVSSWRRYHDFTSHPFH